jgi:hypothetical protein
MQLQMIRVFILLYHFAYLFYHSNGGIYGIFHKYLLELPDHVSPWYFFKISLADAERSPLFSFTTSSRDLSAFNKFCGVIGMLRSSFIGKDIMYFPESDFNLALSIIRSLYRGSFPSFFISYAPLSIGLPLISMNITLRSSTLVMESRVSAKWPLKTFLGLRSFLEKREENDAFPRAGPPTVRTRQEVFSSPIYV